MVRRSSCGVAWVDVLGVVIREGAPVAGASVSIGSAGAVTDVSGRFALKSSPGRVRLQCRVPGAARSIGRELDVSATLGEITIDVTSVILRGRLLDAETGLPAAGMRIAAVPSQSADLAEVAVSARRRMATRSAADGSFVLDGLFAVRYRLEVRPPGADVSAENVAGSSDVDLSGGDLDVTLAVRAPVDQ